MKIAILGDRKRYEAYLPPFVHDLPVELTFFSPSAPSRQILVQSPDTQVILADAIAPVQAELIHGLPRLQLIHSDGVGYNAIDLDAARRRGVYVCNCKGCNADAVAEIAVMLMLMVTRRAVQGYRAVIEGRQMAYKEAVMAAAVPEFADHSVGLVGLGDIAKATARRLAPFGNRLYYYTPHRRSPQEEREWNITYLPLDELVGTCDILSLHCPVTPETEGMLNQALLSKMHPGSYLVNTSRGQLVDNQAVRDALLSGHLAGAGFDTLWPEPTPADHPLVDLPPQVRDRVAYLPHIGGNTGPAFRRAYAAVWDNVRRVLDGERPANIVNGL